MSQHEWENQLVKMRENKELEKKTQLQRINNVYNNKLRQYSNLINSFYRHQRGNERSRDYAFNRLRPRILHMNGQLNGILTKIKTIVNNSNKNIVKNEGLIKINRQSIHGQDKLILDKEKEINSLERQILSGNQRVIISNEKGLFKRNLIIFFILTIVLLLFLILRYYK